MSLAHDDIGRGVPLVLLHAFPFSRVMWRPQIDALKTEGRLILPDLPGFGDSPWPGEAMSVETMADAVANLLDEKGISEKVILGGLSMGGYVAFAFARKYMDRLRGFVLCDTRAEPDDDTAKANRVKMIETASSNPASVVIEQMLPKLLGPRTLAENHAVVEEVKRIASSQKPETIVAALKMLRDRPDSRPTLPTIRVPALIIVGKDDALTPPAMSESMAKEISGSRLEVIDDAGHMANLEQPECFNEALKGFICSASPAS